MSEQPVPGSLEEAQGRPEHAKSPLDAGDRPPLSDHGRPRSCPSCGGASVYARFMAMEGRACRYASKGDAIVAFYCGEHERRREAFDVDLVNDIKGTDIGGWNIEVLDAVKGMSREVLRDLDNLRNLTRGMMVHMGNLEAELAEKRLALSVARKSKQKLLAAVEEKKPKRKRKRNVSRG